MLQGYVGGCHSSANCGYMFQEGRACANSRRPFAISLLACGLPHRLICIVRTAFVSMSSSKRAVMVQRQVSAGTTEPLVLRRFQVAALTPAVSVPQGMRLIIRPAIDLTP